MNYEKLYKEALERARKCLDEKRDTCFVRPDVIFPELKESEDKCIEKIKKDIISYLNNRQITSIAESSATERWLSWLEKQGEKKPVDKVEPKFKVGDWCIDNEDATIFQIVKVLDNTYTYKTNEGSVYSCTHYSLENDARLWTIEDAKDGDVLANDHHILILKELSYDWSCNGTPNSVKAYCGIKPNGNFEIGKDNWCFCGTLHIHPATKEQRDLLFAKMKEAGYEWDIEKKKLKKVEENSFESDSVEKAIRKVGYEWSEDTHQLKKIEPNFHVGDWITNGHCKCQITFIDSRYWYSETCVLGDITSIDKTFRLWTIEDAKDGDVLVSQYNKPFIYNGNRDSFHIGSYCGISVENKFKVATEKCHWTENVNIYPSTKEQSELLFAKMKEAGYGWDEEKKELKNTEKKFKVGDWITFYGGKPFKILKVESEQNGILDYLLLGQNGHDSYYNKKYVDENARFWTIEDAKDGDVLTVNGKPFIYCNVDDYQGNYCCIDSDGMFRTSLDFGFNGKTILPATKEQRELLFKKMKEAGYEWDAEKKTCLSEEKFIESFKKAMNYC